MKLYINDVEAERGMAVKTFRGEPATLISWSAPHKPSSSGRVFIRFQGGACGEYFPSVIGASFSV